MTRRRLFRVAARARRFTAVLVVLAFVAAALAVPANAFETGAHTKIIHRAFDDSRLVAPEVTDFLVSMSEDTDTDQFTSAYHFDSAPDRVTICQRVHDGLQRDMAEAVNAVRPYGENYQSTGDNYARYHFGIVLHEIEDFYSHSNWVELAFEQGQPYPSEAPLLNFLGGCDPNALPDGLQTGYFSLLNGLDGCPGTAFGGPPVPPPGFKYCHSQIAKDHPDSEHGGEKVPGHNFTFHEVAVQLASQTSKAAWLVLHDQVLGQDAGLYSDLDVDCLFHKVGFPEADGEEVGCRLSDATQSMYSPPERWWTGVAVRQATGPELGPPPAATRYYVYVLEGIGFAITTEDDVQKRPLCRWNGGGRDCTKTAKVVDKITGTEDGWAFVQDAKTFLKTKLDCTSGYWGLATVHDGKSYWLQNNVGASDCKTVKQL